MKQLGLLVLAGLIAACGVDGEPVQPTMSTTVGVGSHGTHATTHVGATIGSNVHVGVGVGL